MRSRASTWSSPLPWCLGGPAPKLVTEEAVEGMKPGSVVVDLAGEAGGNCELTEPGQSVVRHDVSILAPLNLPATLPEHASALFARNVLALLELLVGEDGTLKLDFDDEIVKGACIVRAGEIVHAGAEPRSRPPHDPRLRPHHQPGDPRARRASSASWSSPRCPTRCTRR